MNTNKFFLLIFGIGFSIYGLAQPKSAKITETQRIEFDKQFFAGMKEKLINNFAEAEADFRKALAIDPLNANTHFQLATVLQAQRKIQEATIAAEQAVKLDGGNEWYNRFLVELYKKQQLYEPAVKVCEAYYKKSGDVLFLYELSGLQILLNKPEKALEALNEIEKKHGIKEELSRQKEQLYLSMNKLKKAIIEIEKLSNAFPLNMTYKGMLADLYLANGKENEALSIYNKILETEPQNGYAAFSLADYYKIKNDDLKYYENLHKGMISDANPKIKTQVLSKLIPSTDFGSAHKEKCNALIEDFIKTNANDVAPYLFKGDMYLQERNYEEARKFYKQASERNESSLLAWEQILFCDQQMQRFDLMQIDCAKLIELFPTYPTAYLYLSLASKHLKQYDKALQTAREGLNYADNEEMIAQMLNNLGDVAHYAKQYELSDSAYEAALVLQPNNANALNNYAYFLSLRKVKLNKADSMSLKSIKLDPENPSNLDTYGWILYEKKDYENAKTYIEKSLKIAPENAEVVEHLGDILYMLNQKEAALENWVKAKKMGAESDGLNKKIKDKKL
ncbi:MAG: tetratricopeptide repeat protein [Bacteroidia bacterium]|nr:tetratricopeptide repeat protein [Bacteroidia bacterium]